jgi:hypothetical protein
VINNGGNHASLLAAGSASPSHDQIHADAPPIKPGGEPPKSANSTKANQAGVPLRPDVGGVGFRGPVHR